MMQLAWPWMLLALPLPWLVWRIVPPAPTLNAALRVPFYHHFDAVDTDTRKAPCAPRWHWLVAGLAYALLVLAAARPQWLGEAVELPVSGRDLLLAVDLSESMSTEDMKLHGEAANRLAVVQQVAGEFIARRQGDRLGLVLFGQQAYLQAPLTMDRQTVRTFLQEAVIGLAGRATAIGDAIGLGVKRLRERPEQNRVLILLTDGANTAGVMEPRKAAELAAAAGVKIYTIGVGADEMVVRDFFGARRVNPSADLDEKTLTAIAERTGGKYFRARDRESLEKIYHLLDQLEPVVVESQTFRPVQDLHLWPLVLACCLGAMLLWARQGVQASAWK